MSSQGRGQRLRGRSSECATLRGLIATVQSGNSQVLVLRGEAGAAGELAEGKPVTIGADDDAEEILRTMSSRQVRRLPVIDGHDLVGMVALADVARALPDRPVGDLMDAISKP